MPIPKRNYRVANGKSLSALQSAKILELLCAGHNIDQVAKATGSHWHTVRAVQWNNAATVEEHKRLLADRATLAAVDALDVLHEKVRTNGHQMRPAELVPIFGVCVDKALALRGLDPIQVQHSHQHIHAHISEASYQDILAKLPSANNSTTIIDSPSDAT